MFCLQCDCRHAVVAFASCLIWATSGVNAQMSETDDQFEPPNEASSWLDHITFGGTVSGIYQHATLKLGGDDMDMGGGALVIQPELSIVLSPLDEVAFKFGFAEGNAFNDESPFVLAPWAADLEDDVRDINGRGRDYLFEAHYRRVFELETSELALTGGLIDSTSYIDQNRFANDEFSQFMNEALVNGPVAGLPSYDLGAAMEWTSGPWSVNGVIMNVGENDDGNEYNYYGAQIAYRHETEAGESNYRLIVSGTDSEFLDPQGNQNRSRSALMFSADQDLGEGLAIWTRLGVQSGNAAIDHRRLFSGGLNVSGALWGREQDELGIGYGYLNGGNGGLDHTHVFEAYTRFGLQEGLDFSCDVQYMEDAYEAAPGVRGWIFGARLTFSF